MYEYFGAAAFGLVNSGDMDGVSIIPIELEEHTCTNDVYPCVPCVLYLYSVLNIHMVFVCVGRCESVMVFRFLPPRSAHSYHITHMRDAQNIHRRESSSLISFILDNDTATHPVSS